MATADRILIKDVDVLGNEIGHLTASADLSANRFCAVTIGASGVALATAAGKAVGFLQNQPIAYEACLIRGSGFSVAIAGSALATVGAELEIGTNGKLVAKSSGDTVAILLTTASADGDQILVKIV